MGSDEQWAASERQAGGVLRFALATALVSAATVLAVPATSASALTPGVDFVSDPVGDVANSEGDIISASVVPAAGGTTAVTIKVDTYEDPLVSEAWTTGLTAATWEFDTTGDGNSDHSVAVFTLLGALQADVYDAQRQVVCSATASALPASSSYRAVFDTACIDNPRYFQWWAIMGYDTVGGDIELDHAPEVPALAGPVPNPAVESGPSVVAVNPGRVFESRAGQKTVDGQQQGVGRRTAGQVTSVKVAGRAGVPAGAKAAVVNVTAIAPSANGYVTLFPCGSPRPGSSTLNYAAGEVVANGATIRLGTGGAVCVYTHRAMDLILDVTGYVAA